MKTQVNIMKRKVTATTTRATIRVSQAPGAARVTTPNTTTTRTAKAPRAMSRRRANTRRRKAVRARTTTPVAMAAATIIMGVAKADTITRAAEAVQRRASPRVSEINTIRTNITKLTNTGVITMKKGTSMISEKEDHTISSTMIRRRREASSRQVLEETDMERKVNMGRAITGRVTRDIKDTMAIKVIMVTTATMLKRAAFTAAKSTVMDMDKPLVAKFISSAWIANGITKQ